jgi:ATP-binding cassette, subfamily B (MDR/TAP), member 1
MILMIFEGGGVMLTTWFSMFIWAYYAEVNAKRIREAYLKSVLRQEIAYFDNVGAGEITSRIQSDTGEISSPSLLDTTLKDDAQMLDIVQRGMSEKVAMAAQWIASFFTGIIRELPLLVACTQLDYLF